MTSPRCKNHFTSPGPGEVLPHRHGLHYLPSIPLSPLQFHCILWKNSQRSFVQNWKVQSINCPSSPSPHILPTMVLTHQRLLLHSLAPPRGKGSYVFIKQWCSLVAPLMYGGGQGQDYPPKWRLGRWVWLTSSHYSYVPVALKNPQISLVHK